MNKSFYIVRIYGITKDPKTSNYMMVMQYAENGNLRQRLNRDFKSFSQYDKFRALGNISRGLKDIHKEGLTHQDFHSGNILVYISIYQITDLGLCKPANEECNKKVFGVLPYVQWTKKVPRKIIFIYCASNKCQWHMKICGYTLYDVKN